MAVEDDRAYRTLETNDWMGRMEAHEREGWEEGGEHRAGLNWRQSPGVEPPQAFTTFALPFALARAIAFRVSTTSFARFATRP